MIKLISKNNREILAFRVINELEKEDVEWLVKRVDNREEKIDNSVLLYVEFEDFGELTLSRTWNHFKMFLTHILDLMVNVKSIAVVTSNESLKSKLTVEFALVPTVSFKAFDENEKDEALQWLEQYLNTQNSLG